MENSEEIGIRTFEERQISTFKGEKVERIVWQPRFSDWYRINKIHKLKPNMSEEKLNNLNLKCTDLPREVFGLELAEVYDYLEASARYIYEIFPILNLFHKKKDRDANIEHKYYRDDNGVSHHKIKTPYGELTESRRMNSTYPDERMLKNKEDFDAVLYYMKSELQSYEFNEVGYEIFKEINKGRTVSTTDVGRSPYNKCIVELAGTKNTMLLMKRYTQKFDDFCAELEKINLEIMLPEILKSPVDFVSVGENVDCRNDPPPVYEKYELPYFNKVAKACKDAGKFTHAHFDGNLEDLLPYFCDELYPFDGIEAPTFLPQGDVSLQDFKTALGDNIIVLDGIPSTIFLPQFSEKRFVNMVEEVLETFSPNLILGVSDEYSPNGLFKRMKMVSEIVANFDVD